LNLKNIYLAAQLVRTVTRARPTAIQIKELHFFSLLCLEKTIKKQYKFRHCSKATGKLFALKLLVIVKKHPLATKERRMNIRPVAIVKNEEYI